MNERNNRQEVFDLLADLESKLFYASIREKEDYIKETHQLVRKALWTWYHKGAQE